MSKRRKPTPNVTPEAAPAVRCNIDPAAVAKVLPFVTQYDIRWYLRGVLVERLGAPGTRGVVCIGTDGAALAAVIDSEGILEGADRILVDTSRADFRHALRTVARQRRQPRAINYHAAMVARLLIQGTRARISGDFGDEGSALEQYVMPGNCLLDAKFPDWRKVMPVFDNLQPSHIGTINPKYLAPLADLAHRFTSHLQGRAMRCWAWPEESASTASAIQLEGMPEFIAVVMPMKTDAPAEAAKERMRPLLRNPLASRAGAAPEPAAEAAAA